MAPSIKLTYFDIEGAAEPVRLALILTGTEFEDDRIQFPQWADLKPKTPYGQLPVMSVNGGPMKTQSGAMLRWAGSALSNGDKQLYPANHLYDIEEAIGVVDDMKLSWSPLFYLGRSPERVGHPEGFGETDDCKEMVKRLREKWVSDDLPIFLGRISDLIDRSGGKWLAPGDYPSIADCHTVPFLRGFTRGHIDHVDPKCLESHPKVVDYVKRFCALPGVEGRYSNGLGSPSYRA